MSRRDFVKTALLLPVAWALSTLPAHTSDEVDLLAMGDWGGQNLVLQKNVAGQMAAYPAKAGIALHGVLLAGDNFYTPLDNVTDERWQSIFEKMYDAARLNVPFYASLGNHDYEANKANIELDYAKANPSSRWKMPWKWYRVDFPKTNPLVTVLMLDSNSGKLGTNQWKAQMEWLQRELSNPRNGKWLLCSAHHPLFSNGSHGDNQSLQKDWGPLFKKYNVDFYLAGHDHDLQHLEIADYATSFVMCGGGGANTREVNNSHGGWARQMTGFVHIGFDLKKASVRYISDTGLTVHQFEKRIRR